jgi:hypothetical protein
MSAHWVCSITWIKSLFAWRDVKWTPVWRYQENSVTGRRRAIRCGSGYTPLDFDWLERRRDFHPQELNAWPPSSNRVEYDRDGKRIA